MRAQKYTWQAMAVAGLALPVLATARASGANTTRFSTALACARAARSAQRARGGGAGGGNQAQPGGPNSLKRLMT